MKTQEEIKSTVKSKAELREEQLRDECFYLATLDMDSDLSALKEQNVKQQFEIEKLKAQIATQLIQLNEADVSGTQLLLQCKRLRAAYGDKQIEIVKLKSQARFQKAFAGQNFKMEIAWHAGRCPDTSNSTRK